MLLKTLRRAELLDATVPHQTRNVTDSSQFSHECAEISSQTVYAIRETESLASPVPLHTRAVTALRATRWLVP